MPETPAPTIRTSKWGTGMGPPRGFTRETSPDSLLRAGRVGRRRRAQPVGRSRPGCAGWAGRAATVAVVGRLKVMDLFCGTGGFSKGFERTGAYEVVYGIDVLPRSVATFGLNHADALAVTGDIREQSRRDVAEGLGLYRDAVDVVIGGPPCQGFSSIRPHRSTNYDDPRNNLFEEFAAYVGYWQPRALVFENVVGLATHRSGADLAAVQAEFDALGYDTDWRILNAANFGVPQKRERLIVIGVQRGGAIEGPGPTHAGTFRAIGDRDPGRPLRPSPAEPPPPAPTVLDAVRGPPPARSGRSGTAIRAGCFARRRPSRCHLR